MQTVRVALAERAYPIHIGAGLLERADLLVPLLPLRRVALVTNHTVAPLYLDRIARALDAAGVASVRVVVPDGEAHKDWSTLNRVFDALLEQAMKLGGRAIPEPEACAQGRHPGLPQFLRGLLHPAPRGLARRPWSASR